MTNHQQAREAWHDRELLATATFSWPVQEWTVPPPVDPSRDPEYPYWRDHESATMRLADANSPLVVNRYNALRDDFSPDHCERWYVIEAPPIGSGEGAIYSPEYLARKGR